MQELYTSARQLHWIQKPIDTYVSAAAAAKECLLQLEHLFAGMSDSQLQAWVRERTRNWEPVPLQLRLKPGQKPFARPHRGYSTPPGLVPSLEYMLQEAGRSKSTKGTCERWHMTASISSRKASSRRDVSSQALTFQWRGSSSTVELSTLPAKTLPFTTTCMTVALPSTTCVHAHASRLGQNSSSVTPCHGWM